MNTYRALTPAAVGMFAEGVFEADFTPDQEKDLLAAGLVELVPRRYEITSTNYAAGAQGDVVTLALLRENEQVLIDGGHLKRVDAKPAAKAAPRKGK